MKEEKFQVINFIRKLILEIDKELNNFPKKDIDDIIKYATGWIKSINQ